MKSSASKIQLTGYDALFQINEPAKANGDLVQEVPLSELFPFKNHPFQVRDDESMQKKPSITGQFKSAVNQVKESPVPPKAPLNHDSR